MSSTSRDWLVAASIGAVEALKDQGFCRWNYAMRVVQQRARAYGGQANKLSCAAANKKKMMATMQEENAKQSEDSLRKVMYLSCWGPY